MGLEEIERFGYIVEVASVNEALYKACGSCSAACLNGAIQHHGFKNDRILVIKISRKNMDT